MDPPAASDPFRLDQLPAPALSSAVGTLPDICNHLASLLVIRGERERLGSGQQE